MSKKIYFNDPQRLTQLIGANTTVIVAGRRTGKTDSIAAPYVLKCIQRMPGSTGAIVVPTFKHGLTNTIPGMLAAFNRWGYKRDIHYVVGKLPPKHFARPLIDPVDYEHVITFYNGSVAILVSQDRPGSSNSLTLSWILVDEAKFIDYNKLKEETLPAKGGAKCAFSKHSCWHSMLVLSDMPQTKKGSWFLRYEKEMDKDTIDAIKGLVYEIWRLKQQVRECIANGNTPPAYLKQHIRGLDSQLNKLRSVAVYYKEYSSIENIQLLGESYIAQMKRDLTPLTFYTSILCQKIGIAQDGFYSSMTEKHKYDASDFSYLDSLTFGSVCDGLDSRADADVDPDAPICIGMDYNANINWIVAGQPNGNVLRVIKSFYVKFQRKLRELVHDFCNYYATHRNKTVVYYWDATAKGNNYAVNDQDYHWVVCHEFAQCGWTVQDVYMYNPMAHDEKYLIINRGFAGQQRLMPMFNRQNNADLILAIQAAGVARGRNGFRKDKAGEKYAETDEDRLEHRTDGTDAFDNLYLGCEKFPQSQYQVYMPAGIL